MNSLDIGKAAPRLMLRHGPKPSRRHCGFSRPPLPERRLVRDGCVARRARLFGQAARIGRRRLRIWARGAPLAGAGLSETDATCALWRGGGGPPGPHTPHPPPLAAAFLLSIIPTFSVTD